MQAVLHEAFGAPTEALRLAETDAPPVDDHEVLVGVRATSVARGDWLMTKGLPYIARPSYGLRNPKHRIAGLDVAGVVRAVGPEVSRFRVGDEVFGSGHGTLAEYAAIPEAQLTRTPAGITHEQAAAIPTSGAAALRAVRDKAAIGQGDSVLVIGASGGVGSFAVQIAKAHGADVTGVASTRNLDFVRALGADHVIDYTTEGIGEGGRRYRAIIDIAGNRSLSELRRALDPDGTLVIVGGSGGNITMGFGRAVRATAVSPFIGQTLSALISEPNLDDLETLARMVEAGSLAPAVGATYPLADAPRAVADVGGGGGRGKTVVAV